MISSPAEPGGNMTTTHPDDFDPRTPIVSAWTPPSSWYVDPAFLEREKTNVFFNHWQFVGRTDLLPAAGSYFSGCFLGEPYVVVRNASGEIKAFRNVCRHHAAQVAQGEGVAEELVCPYHGWTYDFDGRLKSAPRLGKIEGFDPDLFGLPPLRVETWGPLVFVHFAEPDRDLFADLAPLRERLDAWRFSELQFVARRTYDLACNWKVYVDNYLDGGYHVPGLHGGLAGQLDLEGYRTELFERF
ncbi:MAG: aromatic ring-hydroxylating dioxygenase subunit alpha, partial [Planctomycetales bacterium]